MDVLLERKRLFSGFDGTFCKVDPKIAQNGDETAIFYSMLLLSGSDVFYECCVSLSHDGGKTFPPPHALKRMDKEENGERSYFHLNNAYYHKHSGKWLIFGKLNYYQNDQKPIMINGIAKGIAVYTLFDPLTEEWDADFCEIPLPFPCVTAFPHGQITEDDNGILSLDLYITTEQNKRQASAVHAQYSFDGISLQLCQVSELLEGKEYARGYFEPSTVVHNGLFYMTLRTDEVGMFSVSEDGIHFGTPKIWVWEDGTPIGNCNTMQRFVKIEDNLYLVYTRKDKSNGHVFRNRAPLYMTRFDTDKGCLCKEEEVILVPELGARLGNFSVCPIAEGAAWVIVAEWMQYIGCEKYGSDNSIWLVKVQKN